MKFTKLLPQLAILLFALSCNNAKAEVEKHIIGIVWENQPTIVRTEPPIKNQIEIDKLKKEFQGISKSIDSLEKVISELNTEQYATLKKQEKIIELYKGLLAKLVFYADKLAVNRWYDKELLNIASQTFKKIKAKYTERFGTLNQVNPDLIKEELQLYNSIYDTYITFFNKLSKFL